MMTNEWSRSSACNSNACVEVQWRKSQLSSNQGSCVEVGTCDCDEILVRDSKDRGGPVLSFTPKEWNAFLDGAVKGEFNL